MGLEASPEPHVVDPDMVDTLMTGLGWRTAQQDGVSWNVAVVTWRTGLGGGGRGERNAEEIILR